MFVTQFAFILELILPHGFFTVKTFWQQTDSISWKTRRSAALQRTGGLLQSFPLNSRRGLGGNIVDDAVDVGHHELLDEHPCDAYVRLYQYLRGCDLRFQLHRL